MKIEITVGLLIKQIRECDFKPEPKGLPKTKQDSHTQWQAGLQDFPTPGRSPKYRRKKNKSGESYS